MRSTRYFLALILLGAIPACSSEVTRPPARPAFDSGGYMGTGNRTDSTTVTTPPATTTSYSSGYMGTGN